MGTGTTRSDRKAATAARILEAAQVEFGAHGESGATIRGIARRAGVDASLVLQHYGSKQALFTLAVRPETELTPNDVPAHLAEVLAARLDSLPPATRALMRSMLTSPEAAEVMRTYLQERVDTLAATLDGEDADIRSAVLVSSILGITIARHFLDLRPLADVNDETISDITRTWLPAQSD